MYLKMMLLVFIRYLTQLATVNQGNFRQFSRLIFAWELGDLQELTFFEKERQVSK